MLTPAASDDPRHGRALSFHNVIEIFVLDELRRRHEFSLQHLRRVLDYLRKEFSEVAHPLVELDLSVADRQLFTPRDGRLENLSREGQLAIEAVLRVFLTRVENDAAGKGAFRLYPFVTKHREADAPKTVMMDPRVSFGRPVLSASGIPTSVIADRFRAGESIASIAEDVDQTPKDIEEAIRFETVRVDRDAA